jgi:hypothetical protein
VSIQELITLAGIGQFGILIASALVPQVLDWRAHLAPLPPLLRHLIWTHGAFIVLVIIGFATLSVACAAELASGTRLARAVCGFVALFWGARLVLQFGLFEPREYLTRWWLKAGYHALTVVFACVTSVFAWAALR